MATKKTGGSSKNGRDSKSKRLSIKCGNQEFVFPGQILVRQRGTKYKAGNNVYCSKDHSLMAKTFGYVFYSFNKFENKTYISIKT